nr:hypothetical protein [cyanobacterium endosymbiont of Rhopalodia gibberula]
MYLSKEAKYLQPADGLFPQKVD